MIQRKKIEYYFQSAFDPTINKYVTMLSIEYLTPDDVLNDFRKYKDLNKNRKNKRYRTNWNNENETNNNNQETNKSESEKI